MIVFPNHPSSISLVVTSMVLQVVRAASSYTGLQETSHAFWILPAVVVATFTNGLGLGYALANCLQFSRQISILEHPIVTWSNAANGYGTDMPAQTPHAGSMCLQTCRLLTDALAAQSHDRGAAWPI